MTIEIQISFFAYFSESIKAKKLTWNILYIIDFFRQGDLFQYNNKNSNGKSIPSYDLRKNLYWNEFMIL